MASWWELWHAFAVMPERPDFHRVRIGRQGRVVLPAEVRHRLGLKEGQVLVVREDEGRVILETRESILGRLRAPFETIPRGVSLADELIAERRREAAAERREEADAAGR